MSVDDVRSVKCADPTRCGRYGWRICDACGEMQDAFEALADKVASLERILYPGPQLYEQAQEQR